MLHITLEMVDAPMAPIPCYWQCDLYLAICYRQSRKGLLKVYECIPFYSVVFFYIAPWFFKIYLLKSFVLYCFLWKGHIIHLHFCNSMTSLGNLWPISCWGTTKPSSYGLHIYIQSLRKNSISSIRSNWTSRMLLLPSSDEWGTTTPRIHQDHDSF